MPTPDKLVNIRRPAGSYHIVIHIGEQQHVISDRFTIAKLQRQIAEAMEGNVVIWPSRRWEGLEAACSRWQGNTHRR